MFLDWFSHKWDGMDLPMEDRKRFTRGVFPRGWSEGPSQLRAECLIEGIDPRIEITVRLVQTVERQVLDAEGSPVEYLVVAGKRYASREEAVEHEMRLPSLPNRTATVKAADSKRAELTESGVAAGALTWRWEPLHATVEAWTEEAKPGLHRVQVSVANRLEWDGAEPERSLMRTFYSTQVVMHSPDGAFASLSDPPPHLREDSAACHNEGLWPVPVGEAGDRRTILASQIQLKDYPDVAPQSPGIAHGRRIPFGKTRIAGIRDAA
jgi:hypothetical protein